MADKKISQLTAASTPLAGTEVLPIVQSGATVKVSAANITAGRDVNVRTLLATVADGSYPIGVSGTTKGVRVLTDANATSIQGVDSTLTGSYQPLAFGGSELRLQSNGVTDRWWVDSGGNLVQKTAAKGVNFTANTPAAGMTSQLLNWYEEGTWTPIDASGAGLTLSGTSGFYTRVGRLVTVSGQWTMPSTANTANLAIGGLPFAIGANSTGAFLSDYPTAGEMSLLPTGTNQIFFYGPGGVRRTNANYSVISFYFSASYIV